VLGLSLGKIIFTVLVIVAVWKGFAMLSRLQQQQKERVKAGARRPARRPGKATVDLVECPRCGAFHDPAEPCRCSRPAA
jgi:hypothetical protein